VKKPASVPRLTPSQSAIVKLGRALFDSQITVAEQRGYIRRVHYTEQVAKSAPQDGPIDSDAIAKLGRVLAYAPEKEASAILEVIPPELLERVLGKPDAPREE